VLGVAWLVYACGLAGLLAWAVSARWDRLGSVLGSVRLRVGIGSAIGSVQLLLYCGVVMRSADQRVQRTGLWVDRWWQERAQL